MAADTQVEFKSGLKGLSAARKAAKLGTSAISMARKREEVPGKLGKQSSLSGALSSLRRKGAVR